MFERGEKSDFMFCLSLLSLPLEFDRQRKPSCVQVIPLYIEHALEKGECHKSRDCESNKFSDGCIELIWVACTHTHRKGKGMS